MQLGEFSEEVIKKEVNKIRLPKNELSHEIIQEKENYFILQDEISLTASNLLYSLIFKVLKIDSSSLDNDLKKFYEKNPYSCTKIFLSLNFPF